MKKILLTTAITSLALSGCANHPISTFQPFQTTDLNAAVNSGQLQQKTDTFYIINDSSSSMSDTYLGEGFPGQSEPTKFSVARELLVRMDKSIPNITLSSGLRSFGSGPCVSWGFTKLNQPIQSYSSDSFKTAISSLECSSGGTTLHRAFKAATADLSSAPGNIALIVLSDGHNLQVSPLSAAQELKEQFGDRLCISTVWVGNSDEERGQGLLQQLSDISGCGFSTTASELAATKGMANFVQNIFFEASTLDPTMDGILEGDSDGDGVPDNRDKCPDTPKGAIVDEDGCWSFRGVHFDFDQDSIKSNSGETIENSINVLQQNPEISVELQGHTDDTGSNEYNQDLSERRATSVKQHLINKGINGSRLTTQGYGEKSPATTNNTSEGRAHNRRVIYKPTTTNAKEKQKNGVIAE
ncbi:MAG: OmpA family protein [Methylococcales bacterium]|nr:OmpA family protein [Methylococcales bacterium]